MKKHFSVGPTSPQREGDRRTKNKMAICVPTVSPVSSHTRKEDRWVPKTNNYHRPTSAAAAAAALFCFFLVSDISVLLSICSYPLDERTNKVTSMDRSIRPVPTSGALCPGVLFLELGHLLLLDGSAAAAAENRHFGGSGGVENEKRG